jgi:hypothetical protein
MAHYGCYSYDAEGDVMGMDLRRSGEADVEPNLTVFPSASR